MCVKFSKLVVGAGVGSFQVNSDIRLFDRRDHPFAPTGPRAERRAQRQSRMPQAPAEPARSVLCVGHVRQLGGESPLCNLMEVKH